MQGPIILPLWNMMAPDGSLQPTGTALRELPVAVSSSVGCARRVA
jgi:hypothetical protein